MTGVSVRDVDAQKFINAYAAFLKRQGKLQIPGLSLQTITKEKKKKREDQESTNLKDYYQAGLTPSRLDT